MAKWGVKSGKWGGKKWQAYFFVQCSSVFTKLKFPKTLNTIKILRVYASAIVRLGGAYRKRKTAMRVRGRAVSHSHRQNEKKKISIWCNQGS